MGAAGLSAALDVRPEERRAVGLLIAHSFLIGIPRVLTSTAAMAVFFTRFDASALPWVYLAAAVAIPATGFVRLRLAARLRFSTLLAVDLAFVIAMLLALRASAADPGARWSAMVLPVWYEVEWVILSLEFWGLAGQLMNVRQAKRLYGLIGAGELVAASMAGLLVPTIVARVGTANLLLVSAAAVFGCLVLTRVIVRALPAASRTGAGDEGERPAPYRDLLRSRYIQLLFALVALSYLGYYVVDNAFYNLAHLRHPDEGELASFLGVFWAIVALVTLASRALLSSRILTQYGLVGGLLALPAAVAAGVLFVSISGVMAGSVVTVFWLMALTKLFDQSLRDSIDRSSVLVLYQPLAAGERVRAQTAVEGIVGPIAGGVSGLFLLFLIRGYHFQAVHLTSILLAIVAVWIGVAVWIRREYTRTLSEALARRRLSGVHLALDDASSVAVLQRGVHSAHPAEALYCVGVLGEIQHPSYPALLVDLLEHPAPEVRREALVRIERAALGEARDGVRRRLDDDAAPEVAAAAAVTLAAVGTPDDIAHLTALLDEAPEPVRVGAMTGLLRYGGRVSDVQARLVEDARSPDAGRRRVAARLIAERENPALDDTLLGLLTDGDPGVVAEALGTAGRLAHPRLWPAVVEGLGSPALRGAAVSALLAGGDAAVDVLEERRAQAAAEGDRPLQYRIVRVAGRLPGRAGALLARWSAAPDPELRHAALHARVVRGDRASPEEAPEIEGRVRVEVREAALLVAAAADLEDEPRAEVVRRALAQEIDRARERVLALLALVYAVEAVQRARVNLSSRSAEKRAQAVELVDSLLPQALAEVVVPLLEDLPARERRARLSAAFPQERLSVADRLGALSAAGGSAWVRATARHVLGEMERGDGADLRQGAGGDAVPEGSSAQKGEVMLTTIEKVLILKGVDIFSETPDDILAEVATLLEEVNVDAGDVIFAKGDMGSALYVVVDGRVRVTSQDRVLAELGARDLFGEMAALDPEPRSATVTAVVRTRLFRLEQESLYELMADRIEVVRGVIRVLCARLRRVTDRETSGWGARAE